jgi:uncharacterized iron-regulated membrane protein
MIPTVALLLAAQVDTADATVVYSDTVLARGPEYAATFELPTAPSGTYRVTATDLKWLNVPLQALTFGVFTATGPIKTLVGAGTFEFFNAGTSKLFLQLYARTGAAQSAGLIGVQVESVAVVALPASLWLLLSALGATGFWRWWERRPATRAFAEQFAPAM